MNKTNPQVTEFLDKLEHPFRAEIELLRSMILASVDNLNESIKWNGPNYSIDGKDRITMKIQPPKLIQLIFHRGAKKLSPPESKLIEDDSGLLTWKENDRAIISYSNLHAIHSSSENLTKIIVKWIHATRTQ